MSDYDTWKTTPPDDREPCEDCGGEHAHGKCGPRPSDEEPEPTSPPCTKCSTGRIQYGYGLMGGGIGAYEFCDNDECDYFEKEQDGDEEPPRTPPDGGDNEGGTR